MKLDRLTDAQQQLLAIHRDNWFRIATSTAPADRNAAEAAARELTALGGVDVQRVVWVTTPEAGAAAWRESGGVVLRGSLYDSLWDSLRDSLWDSLWDSLRGSLGGSLYDSLSDPLYDSLSDSLRGSLSDSLRGSLGGSLWDSLWDSLSDSLRGSLWDSPWIAFYLFGVVLGVEYDPEAKRKLLLTATLLRSCFACWVGPGTIVLCERPAAVDVRDGKLVGITWREGESV